MTELEYNKVPVQDIEYNGKQDDTPAKYGFGVRHLQSVLFFLCLATGYASRVHLGVTIVAMAMIKSDPNTTLDATTESIVELNKTIHTVIQDKDVGIDNGTINLSVAGIINEKISVSDWSIYKTYDWPKSIQEMVLGSFFIGYALMMFPIGLVCQRWGGKIPLQIAMAVNAVIPFGTPWIVAWGGWKALCACRILQGLSQSGLYPAVHTLLSNWVPVSERGRLSSCVYTGTAFGTVIAFQVAGVLAFSQFGWPSTFWVSGVACFVVFILFTLFGAAKPAEHKWISKAEKDYISGNMSQAVETKPKVPWKQVLTSVHMWAIFLTHLGSGISYVFLLMQVPTYMYAILHLNIRNSGIMSSLPYIAAFTSAIAFGYLSDFCTNRKIISVKKARILSNTIALVVPSLIMFAVTYTTNTVLAVFSFVMALALHAAVHTGWLVNYMDLSPNYSGALFAFGNTLTNVTVLGLPVLVANIVTDVTNQHQWRITMFLIGGFSIVTNIFSVFFTSVDIQPWNDYYGDEENKNTDAETIKLEPQKEEYKD